MYIGPHEILQLITLIPLWSLKINAKIGFPFDCCLQIEEQEMTIPLVYLVIMVDSSTGMLCNPSVCQVVDGGPKL